jgi:hypothetical protein
VIIRGPRGDGPEDEGVKLLLAKALDHLNPLPPSISTAPATSIPPISLRPAGTITGSILCETG